MFRIPLYLIAITMLIIGPRWIFVEDPWLLDKIANEEILDMSFVELFDDPINETLPEYLRTIYRFFGLWVTSIGILIISQLIFFNVNNSKARLNIQFIVGFILLISMYFGYTKIPSSPFIYLMWIFMALLLISLFGSFKMGKKSESTKL